ncbi:hypothetical protein KKB43_03840 [Patescibacteria group bacterium]|nr:hypothetical protein [Patescibacteria group bacterium]
MNQKIEKAIKPLVFVVTIAFVLFTGIAMAESSAREKVVQEALYALDQSNTNDINKVYAQKTTGNWNWLNIVSEAYTEMKKGYTIKNRETGATTNCFASLWSTATDGSGCSPFTGTKPPSFYNDVGTYGFNEGKGRGMQCKAFTNAVVYATGYAAKNLYTGKEQDIFPSTSALIQYFDDPATITNPTPSEARYSRPGSVIFIKTFTGNDKNNNPIYSYTNYYTVISVNSGNSDTGTVTSIQAKNNLGSVVTIEGDALRQYRISKYARGYQFAKPGDVVFKSARVPNAGATDHFVIVVKTTGNDGSVTAVDVVDSNYVGDEVIGYHTMQTAEIQKYYVYTGVSYYIEPWSPNVNVPIVPPVPSSGTQPVLFHYKNDGYPNDPENGKIYEIRQDTAGRRYKHWIIDAKVFNDLGYDWSKVQDDEKGLNLDLYILGENTGFRDGALIKRADGRIYEIRNNEKHWFPTWNSFAGKGYTLEMTYPVSDQLADLIPNGMAIDYRMVKTAANGDVYVIQGSEKKHVMDPDVMAIWGFDWSKIATISDAEMNSYSYAGELGHARFGTIIEKNMPIVGLTKYFISADQYGAPVKRELRYYETLGYLGATAKPVYLISDSEFSSISYGSAYYKYAYQFPVYAKVISDPNDCASCHIEPMTTPTPIPTPTPTSPPANPPPATPTPNPTLTPTPNPTPTPTPTPNPLEKFDLNSNRTVDMADLVIIAQHFGETTTAPYHAYDINSDGEINILDLSLVAQYIDLIY